MLKWYEYLYYNIFCQGLTHLGGNLFILENSTLILDFHNLIFHFQKSFETTIFFKSLTTFQRLLQKIFILGIHFVKIGIHFVKMGIHFVKLGIHFVHLGIHFVNCFQPLLWSIINIIYIKMQIRITFLYKITNCTESNQTQYTTSSAHSRLFWWYNMN